MGLILVACGGRATEQNKPGGASGSESSMPSGASGAAGNVGLDGGAGATGIAGDTGDTPVCETYRDCPPLNCSSCNATPEGCAPSNCVMGHCFHDSCASIDACYAKMCGDTCQACYGDDGVCTPGTCDRWGDCKATADSCDPFAPVPCTPADASGTGFVNGKTCNNILGWAWGGSTCVPVVGCACAGSDCRSLLETETDCSGNHYMCFAK